VRLELMAGVLNQTQQLLLEASTVPIDEEALLDRSRERACGGCPNRKQCRDIRIPNDMLTRQLTDTSCLSFPCRKPGRMLLELRRTQEQYRNMKAQKDRQKECREAVMQQYYFLGEYLRQAADQLAQRLHRQKEHYQVEVGTASAGKERANGDRCLWFSGTECRYYIVLCDGMGTGLGAAQEAQEAASLLRQMLSAGFPAEYALRSLNSLMVLRGKAAAVTVDLVEIQLDSGKAAIFKWGAAPSYVLRGTGAEKIGTAGPPPGLSVSQTRESVDRLSLRRGEVLILFSDGADANGALRQDGLSPEAPPGELAAKLLEQAGGEKEDDATVAVIRLSPTTLST
jgi:serine/threonine protein phosphatase PrpC